LNVCVPRRRLALTSYKNARSYVTYGNTVFAKSVLFFFAAKEFREKHVIHAKLYGIDI
jgi:hypothetical protein